MLVVGGSNAIQVLADVRLFDEGRQAAPQAVPGVSLALIGGSNVLLAGGAFSFPQEATGGTGNASATNYPIVLSERGDNVALAVQPFANWQPHIPNGNPTPSGVAARPSGIIWMASWGI